MEDALLVPPLPRRVIDVLTRASFCYLATVENDDILGPAPHLCLMRFSWVPDGDQAAGGVLVLSTRRDSRKHAALVAQPAVAVLVHATIDSKDGELSVTVYGDAAVVSGEEGERLRAIHLSRNPGYAQFIDGEGIDIVTVRLRSARVCDMQDRVQAHKW